MGADIPEPVGKEGTFPAFQEGKVQRPWEAQPCSKPGVGSLGQEQAPSVASVRRDSPGLLFAQLVALPVVARLSGMSA